MNTVDLFGMGAIKVKNSDSKSILKKANNPKKVKTVTSEKAIKSKKLSIPEKLNIINENVDKKLGIYKDTTVVIKSREELKKYIDASINNNIVAIDTETNNSLDPLTCKIMGLCLYTPGLDSAYIPVNHTDLDGNRLDWQVTEKDIEEELNKINNIKVLTHNGKFDYQVIWCTCNVKIPIYWDSMIAAKILDENEYSAGLKQQYIDKIDKSIEKYSIDKLFKAIEYKYVDPEIFALYAATDSYMTYKLYEYQFDLLNKPENKKLLKLLFDVELPIIEVVAEMELDGIALDIDYCNRLSDKYHKVLDDINDRLNKELENIRPQIAAWRKTKDANSYASRTVKGKEVKNKKTKNEQLEDPPAFTSPTQLAILLYDVLKAPVVDRKNPRGTGEEVLSKLDLPIAKIILEQRTMLKLIDAFIDAIPKLASEKDGKIHSSFNQMGTKTGRFSCTNPNLQQIPAKNLEVRMMFSAGPGKVLIGSDFSQQEPRILTAFSRDHKLLESYNANRDLYATLGTGVYGNDYWENMEHWEDGSDNLEGKKRRKKMKTLYLGMSYGMGPKLLSENMKCSLDEANKIVNDFHTGFLEVSEWMKKTEDDACQTGYVEDFWGRQRRLPDLLLPEYSFKAKEQSVFNPLFESSGKRANDELIAKYKVKLANISFNAYDKIKQEAKAEGLEITKNGGFIGRAKRQCVNARIQGSAATMTKKAMLAIYHDEEMKKYGFRLLIGVHDELIGQCDEKYAKEASDRLVYLMKNCAPELGVPFKCDPTVERHWYEEEYIKNIKNESESGKSFEELLQNHPEITENVLKKYLHSGSDVL